MSNTALFVQVQGLAGIVEVEVADLATEATLHDALAAAGVTVGPDMLVFIDEAEAHVDRQGGRPVQGLKHGVRVHVARCRRVKTTLHFLDKTLEREFPPGARVRTVKAWAVHELHLDHKDAAEHVLQICNSNERPPSDTPLHVLVRGHDCAVCFDLVPEKRVEG